MSRRALRLTILTAALTVGGAISLFGPVANHLPTYKGDWMVLWHAARMPVEALYLDPERVPFAYPPSALLILKPFGQLPIWTALALWTALSAAAMFLVARQAAIALLMPACVLSLVHGQTGILVGALGWAGVGRFPLLLGLAAAIKPHLLIALPIAYASTRDRNALAWTIAGGLLLVLASVAVWGVDPWLRWVAALDDFLAMIVNHDLARFNVGPKGLVRLFGFPAWAYPLGIAMGAALTWVTFRTTSDLTDRYAALACGSALFSPYVLAYDLAGLSVAAAAMLLDDKHSTTRWLAAGWVLSGVFANFALIALASVLLAEQSSSLRGKRHPFWVRGKAGG